MSERNATADAPEELAHPQAPDRPEYESNEISSNPSLPSIDTQRGDGDTDSAIGSFSGATSTTSLRQSIYKNIEENGRTYHHYKQGKYLLPNDEKEQERLDLQHIIFYLTFGERWYLAPIGQQINHVLDIATGTGNWAVEFANLFPSAQVIGTDLSPIQPQYVPPNLSFEISDAEDDWSFPQKFDYIHGRALLSCFKDPKQVFNQAFSSLAAGGYLELQDACCPFKYIGPPPTASAMYRWNNLCVEGSTKLGRPWTNVQHYKRWMEEIGFEDVVEETFYWPCGTWAKGKHYKQIGRLIQQNFMNGVEGMSLRVIGALGWTVEEIQQLAVEVKKDMQDPNITSYADVKVVYGRKPLPAAVV